MALYITHSKWGSPDHFEALGFDDAHPNMVIRFDFAPQNGWHKWRHGGWLPINADEVPADVMARYAASKPQQERAVPERNADVAFSPIKGEKVRIGSSAPKEVAFIRGYQ